MTIRCITVLLLAGAAAPAAAQEELPLEVSEADGRFTMTFSGGWDGQHVYSLSRGVSVLVEVAGSLRIEPMHPEFLARPVVMLMDQRVSERPLGPQAP